MKALLWLKWKVQWLTSRTFHSTQDWGLEALSWFSSSLCQLEQSHRGHLCLFCLCQWDLGLISLSKNKTVKISQGIFSSWIIEIKMSKTKTIVFSPFIKVGILILTYYWRGYGSSIYWELFKVLLRSPCTWNLAEIKDNINPLYV